MTKGLIGKKIGMTQIFDEAGKVVPVTVIEAGPCVVTQLKTAENDGYEAVQLGFGDVSPKHTNKPMTGHFKKNDLPFKRTLKEFRLDDISNVNVGDVLKADVFAAGDVIDVSGVSKGKGFQGAIKRHNQHRLKVRPRRNSATAKCVRSSQRLWPKGWARISKNTPKKPKI